MNKNKKNNIHDKSYKDLFSNKEALLNLMQSFVSNSWGNKLRKMVKTNGQLLKN